MLTKRIIPCLDIDNGKVVKGQSFNSMKLMGDPIELAEAYYRQGADEIVILDVSATIERRVFRLNLLRQLRKIISIPFTVGGGIRCFEDVAELLSAGADKVSVNTAAVKSPELLSTLSSMFGAQCIVLAIDAARSEFGDNWEVMINSGKTRTKIDVVNWAKTAEQLGVGEILLTSYDQDGKGDGYDLDLIKKVRTAVNVPIIASGGAGDSSHFIAAFNAGADAVLAASVFHKFKCQVSDLKKVIRQNGVEVRL